MPIFAVFFQGKSFPWNIIMQRNSLKKENEKPFCHKNYFETKYLCIETYLSLMSFLNVTF